MADSIILAPAELTQVPCSCPHRNVSHENDCEFAANERAQWRLGISRMELRLLELRLLSSRQP